MIEDQGKKVGRHRCGKPIEPKALPGSFAVKRGRDGRGR
jgi:hypothetical protein